MATRGQALAVDVRNVGRGTPFGMTGSCHQDIKMDIPGPWAIKEPAGRTDRGKDAVRRAQTGI